MELSKFAVPVDGSYPPRTVNDLVSRRLKTMADKLAKYPPEKKRKEPPKEKIVRARSAPDASFARRFPQKRSPDSHPPPLAALSQARGCSADPAPGIHR